MNNNNDDYFNLGGVALYVGIMMMIFMLLKLNQMGGGICISPLDYIYNTHLIEECLKE
ncbi:hypothetical protein Q5L94_02160 [Idiomarina sp. Sol25]|uniref:hypothetical protein n=1 Tax=Idiomarina sp. Sol25 TaxID=3064000 RepID=UPI00294AF6D1|nr:hypothetical protein [Idiomarina sp. Sol25]MDV6326843.1 hypothetical protein [Idiomarina sp. Sol25]